MLKSIVLIVSPVLWVIMLFKHVINFVYVVGFWNRQLEWGSDLAAASGEC
jgi:hypothetical protein